MKNGLLVWNVLLTVIAGYLLIVHFGGSRSNSTTKTTSKDSSGKSASFKIAYFEMDSVEANFLIVKNVKAELSKKETAINIELDQLGKNLQQRYNYFQGQAQSGSLSETQSQAASQELRTMEDAMKNRKLVLDQDYSEYASRSGQDIKKKIEEYLKEYNKTKGYAFIVSTDPGLFYFKDTLYNITADLIKGLNEMYKPKKD